MLRRIVWSAVAAALAAVAGIVSAVLGETNYVLAFGAAAITSALLATRER